MNDRERREYEMAMLVLLFLDKYNNELKGIPAVMAAKAVLIAETQKLAALGVDKISTTGDAKDATIHKGDLRDAMTDAMQSIADMWRPMAKNYDNAKNKFYMPYGGSDQIKIDTAGVFIEDATPLEAAFLARGMQPVDFIADLTAKRDAFNAVVNESDAARLARIGVNAQFREPLKKCLAAVEDIDPIIKMTFRNDAGKRAEWLTASHVARR